MNIFVIPSWYPSPDDLLSGIFVKEQLLGMCRAHQNLNIGVSIWGQQEEQYLLKAKDHVKNLYKLLTASRQPASQKVLPNLTEYHTPAFTWTRKVWHGNIERIIKANLQNFSTFEKQAGAVDLIHAHVGYPAGHIAKELAKLVGRPYLITEHMGPFPSRYTTDRQGNIKPYYLQAYQRAACNIAVSPFHAAELGKYQVPRTVTIPNFVDEDYFKPPAAPPVAAASFTFFTLGDIVAGKGIDLLLRAAKELVAQQPSVSFRIGGDGPCLPAYQQLSRQLGLEKQVTWLGQLNRTQAVAEFQACHAFILPSHYESMGVVYIEALACGKPIIATRCGGPETTVTACNGLLVEKNNIPHLAMAMASMIENYKAYSPTQIREDFLKRFSSKAVVPRLVDLYQKIITLKAKQA